VGPHRETQEDINDAEEMKQEEKGDMEEDENGDYVVVAGTSAQEILLPLMQWLWAVACGLIMPVSPSIHIPARVDKWCDDTVN